MCYRVSRDFSDVDVKLDKKFAVDRTLSEFFPKYNVAITSDLPVIVPGSRILDKYKWGLIPHWAKDKNVGYKMGNARAETILDKTSFKGIFRTNRCLVLVSGFFEWDKDKNPYYFKVKGKRIFAFAGLYDEWKDPLGKIIKTVTIITCEPNKTVKKLHDRMPVILNPKDYDTWLKGDYMDAFELLRPFNDSEMISYEVSKKANNARNDLVEVTEPLGTIKEGQKTL